ncbi:MAG TPA: VOC family protein [Candidatus Didemnitutus sp.]|nr:VOC family protein [Candidatus Didemnitutus sp.]
MNTPRRRFLATGMAAVASLAIPRLVAETPGPPVEPRKPDAPDPASSAKPTDNAARQRVAGIGGFFFRATNPKELSDWYERALGVTPIPQDYNSPPWTQEAGATAFAPFPQDTKYFGRPTQNWMLNFRVHNLDTMVAQLQAMGVKVKVDPQAYPNGRFARLHDPEGNPIELWEPKAAK